MSTSSPSPPRPLKILMLHGFTQSGPLFALKTKALKKSLEKAFPPAPKPGHLTAYPGGVQLTYPTGPMKLDPRDIPGYEPPSSPAAANGHNDNLSEDPSPESYAWWKRQSGTSKSSAYTYEGLEGGIARIAETIQAEGPFDGVIGFSQGASAAGMLAALLETGRREEFQKRSREVERGGSGAGMEFPRSLLKGGPDGEMVVVVQEPLKFAVSYCGFTASSHERYRAFTEPKIATPVCHFIGSVDTVVEEQRSLKLVECCVEGRGREGGVPRVIYHPGGHFLPSSQKPYVAALVGFIREALGEEEVEANGGRQGKMDDVKAEDMDVPF